MSTAKKTAKSTKPVKTAKKTAAAKAAPIGESALARVYKVKKHFENDGVREEFIKAIPKAGASLGVIAKKAGLSASKARGYAYWLASNGYLTRVSA
jgi:hypothetical protein